MKRKILHGPAEIRTQDLRRVKATSFCDPLQERDEKQNLIATGANTRTNTGANTGESVPESFKTFNDLYESYREAFVSWLNHCFMIYCFLNRQRIIAFQSLIGSCKGFRGQHC